MSVVVTRSVRCHFNSPAQQGQRMFVTGTSTGSAPAAAGGASRRWKGPCPGFRPGRLGWALRLPLENGVADRALLRRSFPSFFTSSRNRSFSVWTRVNSSRRDWFSSSKSSIRWCSPSGSGPVIQTTVTDPARNVQRFLFAGQSATTQPARQCRESGTTAPVSTPVILIWAPATRAPCPSRTRPVTEALETACACSAGAVPSTTNVSSTLTAITLLNFLLDITNPEPPFCHLGAIIHPTASVGALFFYSFPLAPKLAV